MADGDKERGLYGKYLVERSDGLEKEGSAYFVLDYGNDPYAREALMYYAYKCQKEYPQLAQDLWIRLRETWK